MTDSPGFNINFESAPFKLTREYVELLGGEHSVAYRKFEELFIQGFKILQSHADRLSALVEVSYVSFMRSFSFSNCISRTLHIYIYIVI